MTKLITPAELVSGEPHWEAGDDVDSSGRGSESSLARMLSVLDFFSTNTPSLTVEEIATRLGVPKSSAYRYVQELCKVGLLVRLDRSITLGPRIIELDRSIRESDPVLRAAVPPMRSLAEQTGLEIFLSKLYGHSVISVHTEEVEHPLHLRFGRGRPLPMAKGSSSKVIVAFLPAAKLRRLHEELTSAGVPDWDPFYEEMQSIRKAGFSRTTGELNEGKTAVSAPIFGRGRSVVASITALGINARMNLFKEEGIARLVMDTARTVSDRLFNDPHQ